MLTRISPLLLLTLLFPILLSGQDVRTFPKEYPVVSPALQKVTDSQPENQPVKIWIYFTDKNLVNSVDERSALKKATTLLSAESLARREQRKLTSQTVGFRDYPVSQQYIQEVLEIPGVQKRRIASRWLNAVSLETEPAALQEIARLPFVRKIDVVRTFIRDLPEVTRRPNENNPFLLKPSQAGLNYGPGREQLTQIRVTEVHDQGYTGKGVRVLMLDTGYFKDHQAVDTSRIVAEWDFIQNDGDTQNDSLDHSNQDDHGTCTMTALGAAVDGVLYGPAYECEYLLAKTEIVDQEIRAEEDNFIAALEWGESMGADVASASLGYLDWYQFSDLDGDTAPITLAVETATRLGMVVVTSVGNENGSPWNHITAPSDADSIISVGAVDRTGTVASFSSRGPTYDGRIKPEVVALGIATLCAGRPDTDTYWYSNGTSLSTPLVGGVVALILEAHPDWNPVDVRRALLSTAGNASSPNNDIGWGLVNAVEAINYQQPEPGIRYFTSNYPNPFSRRTVIHYSIPDSLSGGAPVEMTVYNLLGQQIADFRNQFATGSFIWDVAAPEWNGLSSGIYFYEIRTGNIRTTGKMTLLR
jgi:hypothetical protein